MNIKQILKNHEKWLSGEGGQRANFYKADLSGADLFRVDLSEADLSEANLSEANLSEANLFGVNLSEADLSRANLSEADLSGANFYKADLSRANFYKADLSRANLSEADLSEANLSEANLFGVNLFGVELSYIKGKTIITLSSVRNQAFYVQEDNFIIIGCQCLSVQDWLKHGERIGKENGYRDEDIKIYLDFIRRLS